MLKLCWQHRSLLFELTKRQFLGRYQGSFGGVAWSFIQPLFLLSVYTVAFGVILKARWGFSGGTSQYALMLFSGLIIFNTFSEILIRSPLLIVENPNFVKKIVFPLELLSIITVITALLHAAIAVGVWFLGYIFLFGLPHLTALLFPLIFIAFLPILLGLSWLLAAIGVVIRDITQMTNLLNHALLFLTPIFYSIEAAPPILKKLLLINPLTFIVSQFQLIIFYGQTPALKNLLLYTVFSTLFSYACLMLFRQLRNEFADWI